MAKIGGRLIGFLIVFLILCNINIVFGRKYDKYSIEVENEYDRVQSTTVPTVTKESISLFDTLPKTEEVVASQSVPSDNTVQEEKETEDDVFENQRKSNSTMNQIKGHHQYYNSTIFVDKERVEAYWNKIRNIPVSKMLSHSHRRAMISTLSFDFPFYGHLVKKVIVAPTGFIYIGDYEHSWLAASQYIAPLMANFDTSLLNDSFVRLNDTGSSFTVVWENVYLQDQQDVGKFTFSTTLYKNGDIVFTYFSVPILPKAILADKHSVKVGLSDAYIIDKAVYYARRKTMYEYHTVNFTNADITNSTIIILKALPTCLEYTDCASCVNHVTAFNCSWCPTVNRCSTGLDRQKQDWIKNGCVQHNATEEDSCPAIVSETYTTEDAVVASEATLVTSVTTNSSEDSVEKEEDSFVTDNPGDSTEQKEEETEAEVTLITSVTTNSSDDSVGKKEESLVTDNPGDSTEQKEEETAVTDNSNDDTVKNEEDITTEKILNTEDVTENTTLKTFEKNNLIVNQTKNHDRYYNITFVVDQEKTEAYWNEIRNMQPNGMLSQSHRKLLPIVLSFDFPFHGHPVRNVTVATGGFIYTGDNIWLITKQYIAPLMVNFDISLSNDSFVRFNDTGSSFTVVWENVYLQDQQDVGKFTFSTTLYKNGDIVFTYFSVPILPKAILADKHSVKVGLSDAYIIDKVVYFARRKTMYEYHTVNFANADITNSTIIILKALPTCLEYTDCASCVNHVTAFNCSWCPTVNRCSSGLDRQRQDWIEHGCDQHHETEKDSCPASVSETFTTEESVVASEATLITSITTNLSDDSRGKKADSLVTDNPSDSTEQKEEEIAVTDNSNDNTVQEEKETEDDMSKNERKSNSTVNQIEGYHQYYNSTIFVDKERVEAYRNKIRNIPVSKMLSHSHRRTKMFTLSFDFPFYGHLIRNVTVATGGFIYTGDYVHSWLTATQYIAPLMGNFDISPSNDSFVRLNDTGSSFTVVWENVYLQDQQDVGKFTFSTTLYKNGDIVFTYFSVPILPKSIQDDKRPTNVGLSDACIIDKVVYFALRKTIYEYHKIKFANADISNSTIIILKALPTCLEYTDCASCVNHVTAFNCSWCPTVNRCSSGLDRQRQDWIDHGCDQHHVTEKDSCPAIVSETFTTEEAVDASEATLVTSVTTNSSEDSVEKEEDSFVTDNPGDSTEQKEEETEAEVTLITSVTTNSSDDSVGKKEESLVTDNPGDSTEQKEEETEAEATLITSVTTNSSDDSVEKEEESFVIDNPSDSTEQKEEETAVTAEKNNLIGNQTKDPTMNPDII